MDCSIFGFSAIGVSRMIVRQTWASRLTKSVRTSRQRRPNCRKAFSFAVRKPLSLIASCVYLEENS